MLTDQHGFGAVPGFHEDDDIAASIAGELEVRDDGSVSVVEGDPRDVNPRLAGGT
jgi:hypothetical protein